MRHSFCIDRLLCGSTVGHPSDSWASCLRFFDMTLQKNVKSHVFLDFEKKRKKRILELWPDDDPLWPRHRLTTLFSLIESLISGRCCQCSEPIFRYRRWNVSCLQPESFEIIFLLQCNAAEAFTKSFKGKRWRPRLRSCIQQLGGGYFEHCLSLMIIYN